MNMPENSSGKRRNLCSWKTALSRSSKNWVLNVAFHVSLLYVSEILLWVSVLLLPNTQTTPRYCFLLCFAVHCCNEKTTTSRSEYFPAVTWRGSSALTSGTTGDKQGSETIAGCKTWHDKLSHSHFDVTSIFFIYLLYLWTCMSQTGVASLTFGWLCYEQSVWFARS